MTDAKAIFRGEISRRDRGFCREGDIYFKVTVQKSDESDEGFTLIAEVPESTINLHESARFFYEAIEKVNRVGVFYEQAKNTQPTSFTIGIDKLFAYLEDLTAREEEEQAPSLLDALDVYQQIIELAQGFRTRVKSAGFSEEAAELAALNLLNQLIIVGTTQNNKEV